MPSKDLKCADIVLIERLQNRFKKKCFLVEGMLRCGKSKVYIKQECVCSFHNVYEASKYHKYSSCPHGEKSDVVTKLKC